MTIDRWPEGFNTYWPEPYEAPPKKRGRERRVVEFQWICHWPTDDYDDENYWYPYAPLSSIGKLHNFSPEPAFAGMFSVGELLEEFLS